MNKKGTLAVSTVIILVIVIVTLVVVAAVSLYIFGGISLLWLSQKPCLSLEQLEEKVEFACKYGYEMRADLNIPTKQRGSHLIILPHESNPYQITGYDPTINIDYPECRGGLCICLASSATNEVPEPTKTCRFCFPIIKQSESPAFCCNAGICRIDNIGAIPNANSKFVNVSEDLETRLFEGVTFSLQNQTTNVSWLQDYCNNTIYRESGNEGIFILDYNYTNTTTIAETGESVNISIISGCCFRRDSASGSCVKNEFSVVENPTFLIEFVNLTNGEWPLGNRTTIKINDKKTAEGGVFFNITTFKLWWQK